MPFNQSNTALATVGAGTLTAAALLGQSITRTGPVGSFTDTTDTATNLFAASGGVFGTTWTVQYLNVSGQTATLAGGTGVTLTANSGTSLTVATATRAVILFTLTAGYLVTAQVLYKNTIS